MAIATKPPESFHVRRTLGAGASLQSSTTAARITAQHEVISTPPGDCLGREREVTQAPAYRAGGVSPGHPGSQACGLPVHPRQGTLGPLHIEPGGCDHL